MVREDTGNTALLARSLYKSSIRSDQDHMTTNDADIEAFLSENDSFLKKDVGVGCIPRRGEWDKPDGRLHYEYPLYCEGMPKPAFRGIFHLLCCFIIPFGMWILVKESNGNAYSIVASVLYMLTNLWCYGASAMYHVGTWSAKTEILLQKLDHAGIAIMSVGTFLPTIVLLMPPQEGLLFLLLLMATCAKNIHGIVNLQPSLVDQVVVPATSVLFFYRLYEVFPQSSVSTSSRYS
jgi:hypothetical protein